MELPNRPTKDPYQELPIKDYSYINTRSNIPKKSSNKLGLIIGIVIALVLIGGGAYAFIHYAKHKPIKHISNTSHKQQTVSSSTSTGSLPTNSYTSTAFSFTVNYPTTWTVSSQGNSSVSISSPSMALTSATGKSVNGKIVFNVFNQGQLPAAFGSGSVAVLDSQDLNFSSPTPYQAAQTYISFVQYPATTAKGGLDGIYVTGNNGFVKDGSIAGAQVNQVSPLIYFNFVECKNRACTNTVPLTISSNMWSSTSFSTPLINIIKSLSFS